MSFKMLIFTILLSCLFDLAASQVSCATTPAANAFTPVVMTYTPYMAPQVGPTSTIYETIVTSWYNALDCRYVTPLRVDANPPPQGPFTTYVRSPTLLVTRVGCMPETTAVTRRDIRGANELELRTVGAEQTHKNHKRRTAQDAIDQIVNEMPDTFPPDLTDLTVQAYLYLTSVNTAVFAINLIEVGVELNQTCTQLRNPVSQAKLFRSTVDPIQAADIVCFAAENGFYLPAPVNEVVTYLEDLIYAIQVRSKYTPDSDAFCWSLQTVNSPWLGIDLAGISQYLCPDNATTTIGPSFTITVPPSQVTSTGAQGTGATSTAGPPTGGPFANTTAAEATSGTGATANSTASGMTATSIPYANSTTTASSAEATTNEIGTIGTYGTSITFPNATYTGFGTGVGTGAGTGTALGTGNLPLVPTSVSPEIETVSSDPKRRFQRW